jgi:elongation factor P
LSAPPARALAARVHHIESPREEGQMAEVVDTNQFRNGMHIEIDGTVWRIVWFQHHKPGKGGAVMRTKLKNLDSGSTVDKTFRAGEKFPRVHTETRNMQYLYNDGENFVFMDPETYDQVPLEADVVGDAAPFLTDGMQVQLFFLDDRAAGVEVPTTVELSVTETQPAVRGDTVGNVTKPAVLENGVTVQVPSFVTEGDRLKIDTREGGSYISRV